MVTGFGGSGEPVVVPQLSLRRMKMPTKNVGRPDRISFSRTELKPGPTVANEFSEHGCNIWI